ncbi:MAG: hypothetical protein LAP38_01385 [Acidobacteriia bacterium]|nr:hypothetical protein [Terriglobia bacterium]
MRPLFVFALVSLGLTLPLAAQVPQMGTVEPGTGKIGSVLKVHGIYLGKNRVDEVYLTDHTFDMKVKVLAQADDVIEFRIPPSAKPGRLQLLVKTVGKQPVLLEQPVYVTVEEKDSSPEVAAATH